MKYKIFASIKGTEIEFTDTLDFKNDEEALQYASECAYELYYLNPIKDILEIEKEQNVNEDLANMLFILQMLSKVSYSIKEVTEGDKIE